MASKEEALLWLRELHAYEEKMVQLWEKNFQGLLTGWELPDETRSELAELANTLATETHQHEQELDSIKKYIEAGGGNDY